MKKRLKNFVELDYSRPLVIAHRGDRINAPENTLPAFEKAVELGCPMLELDLALSKDRQVVVLHDETIERTTNGAGRVKDLTLEELRSLDAGFWFSDEYRGTFLPTLDEVLQSCGHRILFNLEIKPEAFEPGGKDRITVQIVAALNKYQLRDQALLSSFSTEVLEDIAAMPNAPALAYLVEQYDPVCLEWMTQFKVFSLNLLSQLQPEQVRQIKRAGFRLFCYTVNEPLEMMKLWAMGVDGVFTDDPTRLLAQVEQLT